MKSTLRNSLYAIAAVTVVNLSLINTAAAHCDSVDGPVITEAKVALAGGDVTPLLKWVPAADEEQIRTVFDKAVRVRKLGGDAEAFADHQLFATLVQVHRASEGAPFTGIKPAGGIDPAVMAADAGLVKGNIDELVAKITAKFEKTVRERFDAAAKSRARSDASVREGREFVEDYVRYIHYVEGVHDAVTATNAHDHGDASTTAEAHGH